MPRDASKQSVFHRAHSLVLEIYRVTRCLPSDEPYGLSAQLRRAAISVPTNLAEGSARVTPREDRHFIGVALGSATEIQHLLQLLVDLCQVAEDDVAACRTCSGRVVRELQNLLKAVSGFET
jgi:four helix bundle protein